MKKPASMQSVGRRGADMGIEQCEFIGELPARKAGAGHEGLGKKGRRGVARRFKQRGGDLARGINFPSSILAALHSIAIRFFFIRKLNDGSNRGGDACSDGVT
jgi:hypothetical protein